MHEAHPGSDDALADEATLTRARGDQAGSEERPEQDRTDTASGAGTKSNRIEIAS